MEPFLIFGLSWIGFLFGLQFEWRRIKKIPRFFFSITAFQALFTFVAVSVVMLLVFKKFFLLPGNIILMIALTLGSSAACTAQSALVIVGKNFKVKEQKLFELLRYISSVDGLFAIFFFIAALSIIPGGDLTDFNIWKSFQWILISIGIGVFPGLILISLSRVRFTQQEFILFLIGTVMFCGGMAHSIHHSPLIAGSICGIITANFCRHHLRALYTVLQAEKSIYIILLLFLGANWNFRLDFSLLIMILYFGSRLLGKVFGMYSGSQLLKPKFDIPPLLGLGLISEGGLAVAIVINFKILYPMIGDTLITIIIVSVFLSEFLGPKLISRQLIEKKSPAIVESPPDKSSTQKKD
jgi:hypothetical protein